MEVGGAAPGLPGPEALETEWSSSSSEESPVYATKPVFNLFAADSEREILEGSKKTWGEWGYGEKKKKHQTQKQKQYGASELIQKHIEGGKTVYQWSRGWGQPLECSHGLVGSDS